MINERVLINLPDRGVILESQVHKNSKSIEYTVTERGCWVCTSHSTNNMGYHRIHRNSKCVLLHRYVYELLVKKIEDGLCLLHICDNPSCINPEHHIEGTHRDNMLDMRSKNRGYSNNLNGSTGSLSKLSPEQVSNIRSLYDLGTVSQVVLASMFNVSKGCIWSIVHNKNWRHI